MQKNRRKKEKRTKMILILRCPKCKNNMKYNAASILLADKRKRCVYCGRSFKIKDNIIKK